jgi:hypothetical protein
MGLSFMMRPEKDVERTYSRIQYITLTASGRVGVGTVYMYGEAGQKLLPTLNKATTISSDLSLNIRRPNRRSTLC